MLPTRLKLFHILGFLSKILNCWTKGFLHSFLGQSYYFYNIQNIVWQAQFHLFKVIQLIFVDANVN
jgi:hypothetical protein